MGQQQRQEACPECLWILTRVEIRVDNFDDARKVQHFNCLRLETGIGSGSTQMGNVALLVGHRLLAVA
jgi:hypothetical protein